MKKIFSILALLLMAVSGAWAQAPQTSTLLTTIENGGDNSSFTSGSKTFDGIATVTLNGNISNDGDEWGWFTTSLDPCTIAVTAVGGYTITSCKFYTESGSAEDTQSPFEASVRYDGDYSAWVNGNSIGEVGVIKIEVYGYAPTTVAITGITLSQTEAAMTVGGDALTLTTTVAPDNATDKTVAWTTSDASVATVADGVVTAVAAGTATITATATNGTADTSDDQTATCTVTVSNPTVTANEGATGEYWATYYNGTTSFTADENTTVFQAALSGSSLTLTEVPNREIPATKAVILKSSSATITLTPASTTETLEGNELQGTATSITNPGNAYVLNKTATNGVGFYKLSSTGTIGANKAYLTYSGASLARSFFGFDETTGIELPTAEVVDTDGVVYDLQGRRVAQPTKGLYIVNGKKVIIK